MGELGFDETQTLSVRGAFPYFTNGKILCQDEDGETEIRPIAHIPFHRFAPSPEDTFARFTAGVWEELLLPELE